MRCRVCEEQRESEQWKASRLKKLKDPAITRNKQSSS